MLYPLSYEGGAVSLGAGSGPIVYDRWRRDGGQHDGTRSAGPPFL